MPILSLINEQSNRVMDFSIISRLLLKEAFSGCSKFDEIKTEEDYLKELFDFSNRALSFVYDNLEKGYSVFIYDTQGIGSDKVLIVKNSNHKDIYLLRIDGVLYKKDSKCDCAIITNNDLLFIEFKTNAANKTDNTIAGNYYKCYSQLEQTVIDFFERFKAIGFDISSCLDSIFAYAVFNKSVPSDLSTQKALSVKFLKSTGIKLRFDNIVTLS